MAGYSQLKASTCIVAVNIMLFNYILSSLTKPDPCLIESNCTNLVSDEPLLKNKKTKLVYGYFSLISLIKTNRYFYQFGSGIPSIRQVTHRKPPFYSSSTKRFSCNGLSTGPVAEALHEQDTLIESRESRIDIDSEQEKVAVEGTTAAMQELQAAENRQFWITTSEGTPEKYPNYKGTWEASQPR